MTSEEVPLVRLLSTSVVEGNALGIGWSAASAGSAGGSGLGDPIALFGVGGGLGFGDAMGDVPVAVEILGS